MRISVRSFRSGTGHVARRAVILHRLRVILEVRRSEARERAQIFGRVGVGRHRAHRGRSRRIRAACTGAGVCARIAPANKSINAINLISAPNLSWTTCSRAALKIRNTLQSRDREGAVCAFFNKP